MENRIKLAIELEYKHVESDINEIKHDDLLQVLDKVGGLDEQTERGHTANGRTSKTVPVNQK